MLNAHFTEGEVRCAIFDSYADGAPSPDGPPFLIYHFFWDLVKQDLMDIFHAWNKVDLDPF